MSDFISEKKRKFLLAVKKAAKHLGEEPPYVKFWDGACPRSTGDEVAHIHVEERVICISISKLHQLNFDEIEETATHEVAHLVRKPHDSKFHKAHVQLKIATWTPPEGTVVISERVRTNERCNYWGCHSPVNLKKCPFCRYFFCSTHFNPYPPGKPGEKYNPTKKAGHYCTTFDEQRDKLPPHRPTTQREPLTKILLSSHEVKLPSIDSKWLKLFTDRVAPFLHKLEDYCPKNSEFIARLSLRLGGLRDEFKSSTVSELKKKYLLLESLEIALLCYLKESSPLHPPELLPEIRAYCEQIDRGLDKELLMPRYEIFLKTVNSPQKETSAPSEGISSHSKRKEPPYEQPPPSLPKEPSRSPELPAEPPLRSGSDRDKPLGLLFVLFVLAFLGLIITLFVLTPTPTTESINQSENLTLPPPPEPLMVPINISFENYLANKDTYDGQRATLIGFLNRHIEGSGTGGVYVEFLMDDFGNMIGLLSLTPDKKTLFPKTGTTEDLYKVEGTFRRKYQGLDIFVTSIEPTTRPTEVVRLS